MIAVLVASLCFILAIVLTAENFTWSDLEGKSESEVLSMIDAPISRRQIILNPGERLLGYQQAIAQKYNPSDPGFESVDLLELSWANGNQIYRAYLHRVNGTFRVFAGIDYESDRAF